MKFDFSNDDLMIDVLGEYSKLPESVRKYISKQILEELNHMIVDMEHCGSPIEQLLSIELNKQADNALPMYTIDYFIETQSKIKVGDSTYRVDFSIAVMYQGKLYKFVIECDGHEFHEKTKEQAKKDKKRDRDLIIGGYMVIRFTGSEIYQNPKICAREAINIIVTYLNKG